MKNQQFSKELLLLFFIGGITLGSISTILDSALNHTALANSQENIYVLGMVESPPKRDGNLLTFNLRVSYYLVNNNQWQKVNELVYIKQTFKDHNEFLISKKVHYKDYLRLLLTLKKPGVARNPGAFDFQKHLKEQHIHWVGEYENLEIVQQTNKKHPLVLLNRVKEHLELALKRAFPEKYADLLQGILLKEQLLIDKDTKEAYRQVGGGHLLAVVSTQLTFLSQILYTLGGRLRITRESNILILLLLLPCYALLLGAGTGIIRNMLVIMLTYLLVYFKLVRRDMLSILALACTGQLLWNPQLLYSAGFHFSYLTATLNCLIHENTPPPTCYRSLLKHKLLTTLTIQAALFPLLVYHFNYFSWWSPIVNLTLTPVISLFFPLTIIATISSQLGSQHFVHLLSFVLDLCQAFIRCLGWSPIATRSFITPPWWWILGYYTLLYVAWHNWKKGRQQPFGILSLLGVVGWIFWLAHPLGIKPTILSITFLDVGQGDAMIIETEHGETFLIDCGGRPEFKQEAWQKKHQSFEVGHDLLLPYLRFQGINNIKYLILTHGDADHIGGAQAIVEKLNVETVIHNANRAKSRLEKKLIETIKEKKIPILIPKNNAVLRLGPGAQLKFLPSPTQVVHKANNDSIVTLLSFYGIKILCTGDIEQEREEELIKQVQNLKVDILKVAHHGSKTSTSDSWLISTSPAIGIISVGKQNRYGHPTTEVLSRLNKYGVRILRTDHAGAITYHFYPTGYREKIQIN